MLIDIALKEYLAKASVFTGSANQDDMLFYMNAVKGFLCPFMDGALGNSHWIYSTLAMQGEIPFICQECYTVTWGRRDYIHNNLVSVTCTKCKAVIIGWSTLEQFLQEVNE